MRIKIFLILIFGFKISAGQIKVSSFINKSSIAKEEYNKLYFVDFWATWCGPCIHVSKYLETLQKKYPKDFYIVSLSEENPELVKKFAKKHNMKLAVAIDFDGETFHKNNIRSLPYGILYNASGKMLWEGHPAEIKDYHIDKYLRQNSKRASFNKMFVIENSDSLKIEEAYSPIKDFEFAELESKEDVESLEVIHSEGFMELKGSLQNILSYSNKVYKNQIKITSDLNKHYRMYFKYGSNAYLNMNNTILMALKLKEEKSLGNGDVIFLNFRNATLWDKSQIDWGENNKKYLIGNTEIEADNVSLADMFYKLSSILETPIVLDDKSSSTELHDWQIHYKYFDLMVSNLSDTYGIKVDKQIASFPEYIITKKAP
ncbi:TlpA family protein disulfide reductase [Seonamhaeicola sediminis]|uniref:TlpA family protein disulfide reductase n=1 Tax=Seonamhaeicola sediminis TaxID=2528206 RepID=A0A562YDE2_9FLAO|nr:TlpA disulfide reductase family protein [Seonamhaeicola sediminis]TWO32635.1 TlpA family protein disulfide reductase [Seonamhaeicola sediminis]